MLRRAPRDRRRSHWPSPHDEPALAGGWAEVKPDASTTDGPPARARRIVLGFTVLQHSVTPASLGDTHGPSRGVDSGATHDVPARRSATRGTSRRRAPTDRGGVLDVVRVKFPELASDELVSDIVAVHDPPTGRVPAFRPDATATAVAATKAVGVGVEQRHDIPERTGRDWGVLLAEPTRSMSAGRGRHAIAVAASSPTAAAAPRQPYGLLLAGVLLLAVLAGGLTAFAIVGLAGRSARERRSQPAAHLREDRPRRELLAEQPAEPGRALGAGTASSHRRSIASPSAYTKT